MVRSRETPRDGLFESQIEILKKILKMTTQTTENDGKLCEELDCEYILLVVFWIILL